VSWLPNLGYLERMTGIEPAPSVWKTEALPLSYIRMPEHFQRRYILWVRIAEVVFFWKFSVKNHRGVA